MFLLSTLTRPVKFITDPRVRVNPRVRGYSQTSRSDIQCISLSFESSFRVNQRRKAFCVLASVLKLISSSHSHDYVSRLLCTAAYLVLPSISRFSLMSERRRLSVDRQTNWQMF